MRVIALKSFTDTETGESHGYGHEFDEPEGAKLDGWLKDGAVREDDRGSAKPPAAGKKKAK